MRLSILQWRTHVKEKPEQLPSRRGGGHGGTPCDFLYNRPKAIPVLSPRRVEQKKNLPNRACILPISVGMDPPNLLPSNRSSCSDCRFPISVGTVPARLVALRWRSATGTMFPISVGMGPVRPPLPFASSL